MMAKAIELRNWMPLYTLEHARAGVQPIRQVLASGRVELYHPPILQYRVREKQADAPPAWGDWEAVGYTREGDGAPAEP
jgi:hypothetical protein